MADWARHLLLYEDGRFLKDQLFCLYVHDVIQRHDNNGKGNFFYNNKNWFGTNTPTLDDLKLQIRNGDFTFVSKLRYFGSQIRGTDGFWRSKTEELETWIDYHVTQGHGPPTHFITLTCAENWWPDLKRILSNNDEGTETNTPQNNLTQFRNHCRNVRKKHYM